MTTDRPTFRALVADVAARAKARLPEAVNGRIESAVKLVLVQDVTPQEDGSILVGSSTDPLKTYRLVGTACECQDFTRGQAPDGWCQHRIAAGIAKRVQELLPQTPVAQDAQEPWPDNDTDPGGIGNADSTPAPEAAFSLTLKGTLDGQEALLTARGMTAAEFTANLAAIRGLLDPVSARTPAAGPSQGPEGWCTKHGVQMKENVKDGRRWFSHQVDGRWCKGGRP